jgi:hypothetical protein
MNVTEIQKGFAEVEAEEMALELYNGGLDCPRTTRYAGIIKGANGLQLRDTSSELHIK